MSILQLAYILISILMFRQALVLVSILRSRRFLLCDESTKVLDFKQLSFIIALPVLREAKDLHQSVKYFETLTEGFDATIIVITTEREQAEANLLSSTNDTVAMARNIASQSDGKIVHLHYPNSSGVKADQLNFAVEKYAVMLSGKKELDRTYFVVYDIDSRPPIDSLNTFSREILARPDVNVFHQSSRFELRGQTGDNGQTILNSLRRAVADSGSLRANRFVLAYELPRLLGRSSTTSSLRRWLNSYVYAHVTGHGLCIRLSFVKKVPFPARAPLEDMYYSFIIGSHKVEMVPISSLDCAEVPANISIQFKQLTRWFLGPARYRQYYADKNVQRGMRAFLMSLSAAAISAEWLSCAILIPILGLIAFWGDIYACLIVGLIFFIYVLQLVVVEEVMYRNACITASILRILWYPITFTIFGIAGATGLYLLLKKQTEVGKTERP